MSTNSKRRRETHRRREPSLVAVGGDSVAELLRLRELLAADVAEHAAHSLDGLAELIRDKQVIEDRVQALDPDAFEARWADWLRRDLELAHRSEDGHRACVTCRALRSQPSSAA